MDVSRLLAVVGDIESEYQGGLTQLLRGLIKQYTTARDAPTQDNTPAIQAALRSLVEYVGASVFVQYPPSKTAVLHAIGGLHRVGPGFREQLDKILSIAGQTTAGIVSGLAELDRDGEAFRKACNETKGGLESLGVTPYAIPVGEFEVGVLIPERLVDQKLGALAKELEGWNKIVRVFQEVAGEDEREVTVAALASGSYELYVPLGIVAAGLVSRTIDKVLEWYLRILEIRKRRLELQDLGAPVAEANVVKKHERDLIDKEIRALAGELVKQVNSKIDANRKNELETQLTLSIRQIARFVDKGGTVEVDSTPPERPEEPPPLPEEEQPTPAATQEYARLKADFTRLNSEFEKVSHILQAGSSLRRLPERSESILQLTDGEPDEAAGPEKPVKKKS